MFSLDAYFLEAASGGEVEFFEGGIEVIGDFCHVGDVGFGVVGVGVAQSCAYGLVDEDDIVVIGPGVLVADHVEGFGIAGFEPEWT